MKPHSFLRWAGSKQQLVPELAKYWNKEKHLRYLEPFMGSAKLFFSLEIEEAILSDINSELVETFNQIKNNPYSVFKILKAFDVNKETYYKVRSLNPNNLGVNQRVARFIYLNKLCFNGLYRTNQNGEFNVPYSGVNKINYEAEFKIIITASKRLNCADILHGDFETIIRNNVRAGDFIYIDPPYAVENRRIFKQYGPQTFGVSDLLRLKELLDFIESQGADFLLSYAYCKEALEAFKKWNMKKKFTQRNISGFSKFRRKAAELLVSNGNAI